MDVLTEDPTGVWTAWPNAVVGLAAAAAPGPKRLMLFSACPDVDLEVLTAALSLLRARVGDGLEIVVASPHPATSWLVPLRQAGVEHLWLLARPERGWSRRTTLDEPYEVVGTPCPALQVRTYDRCTLSVCGNLGERLVLARHHLQRWCLGDREACAHWQAAREGSEA